MRRTGSAYSISTRKSIQSSLRGPISGFEYDKTLCVILAPVVNQIRVGAWSGPTAAIGVSEQVLMRCQRMAKHSSAQAENSEALLANF